MRIAIVSNGYPSRSRGLMTGAFVEDRALLYQEAGHEVTVFAKPLGLPSEEVEQGVPVFRIPVGEASVKIAELKPDVLAVHAPHRFSLNLAERVSFPEVVWFHGWELEKRHPVFDSYSLPIRKAIHLYDHWKLFRLKRFLKQRMFLVFNSRWLLNRARKNLGLDLSSEYAQVIPNPLDLRKFMERAARADNARPAGIVVAALKPHKGLDLLIRAAAGLRETQITIYGTGPEERKLHALVRKCAAPVQIRHEIIPHEKIPGLLSGFDYALLPSRYEPQGLFLLEAMACGLPAVAPRVGGIPEYLEDGKNGCLAEPESPPSLRQAILRLLSSGKMSAMGKIARASVEQFCSSARIIPQEIEIMTQATKREAIP